MVISILIINYTVNLLLILALALGLTLDHLVNGSVLLLVLIALFYTIAVLIKHRFQPAQPDQVNFALSGMQVAVFIAFALYAIYNLILYNLADADARNKYESYFLLVIPLYFLLRNTRLNFRYLCYALTFSGSALGIHAAYQVFYLHYGRAIGVHYAIGFGDMALLFAVFNVLLVNYYTQSWQKILAIIASISACFACFLSSTRGAWVAIPLLVIFIAWVYWHEHAYRKQNQKSSSPVGKSIVLALIAILSVLVFSQKERISNRWHQTVDNVQLYQQGNIQSKSVILRLEMWRAAWQMFKENPISGAGYYSFNKEMRRLYQEKVLDVPQQFQDVILTFRNPHNQYLSALGSKGLIGLILLLAVLCLPLVAFYRYTCSSASRVRLVAYLGMVSVIAFMIFSLTETVFHRNFLIIYYLLLVQLFMALIQRLNDSNFNNFNFK